MRRHIHRPPQMQMRQLMPRARHNNWHPARTRLERDLNATRLPGTRRTRQSNGMRKPRIRSHTIRNTKHVEQSGFARGSGVALHRAARSHCTGCNRFPEKRTPAETKIVRHPSVLTRGSKVLDALNALSPVRSRLRQQHAQRTTRHPRQFAICAARQHHGNLRTHHNTRR